MEGEGGRFRRRHLVPIPVVTSLGELNQHLEAADVADDARRIGHRTSTVGEDFAAERPRLLPCRPSVERPGCCRRAGSTTRPATACVSNRTGPGPPRAAGLSTYAGA